MSDSWKSGGENNDCGCIYPRARIFFESHRLDIGRPLYWLHYTVGIIIYLLRKGCVGELVPLIKSRRYAFHAIRRANVAGAEEQPL